MPREADHVFNRGDRVKCGAILQDAEVGTQESINLSYTLNIRKMNLRNRQLVSTASPNTFPSFLCVSLSHTLSLSPFLIRRVYRIFCAKGLLKTAYNNKWVISHVTVVVSLVTVIMVPIYILLGGGKSSRHTISEDTEQLTKFFVPYQSTR